MLNDKPIFLISGENENGKHFYFSGMSMTIEDARKRCEEIQREFQQELFFEYFANPSPLHSLQIEEWHHSSVVETIPYIHNGE